MAELRRRVCEADTFGQITREFGLFGEIENAHAIREKTGLLKMMDMGYPQKEGHIGNALRLLPGTDMLDTLTVDGVSIREGSGISLTIKKEKQAVCTAGISFGESGTPDTYTFTRSGGGQNLTVTVNYRNGFFDGMTITDSGKLNMKIDGKGKYVLRVSRKDEEEGTLENTRLYLEDTLFSLFSTAAGFAVPLS